MQVELAFQEAKADVTRYWIDLKNKPEWFAMRVNPASKVRDIRVLPPRVLTHPSCHRSQL
jgi:glutathione S-transferase